VKTSEMIERRYVLHFVCNASMSICNICSRDAPPDYGIARCAHKKKLDCCFASMLVGIIVKSHDYRRRPTSAATTLRPRPAPTSRVTAPLLGDAAGELAAGLAAADDAGLPLDVPEGAAEPDDELPDAEPPMAADWNALKVLVPFVGGLTAKTMPRWQ